MLKVIFFVTIFYLLLIGVMYVIQRQYIYLPLDGEIQPVRLNLPEVKLIQLKTNDGLLLNSWYHPAKKSLPTILYFHGNQGNIGDRGFIIAPFVKAGYGVLLLGYRGYSSNPGRPTEKGLYRDARAAINFLKKENVPMHCVVLLGESLGSGVAVQMATEFPVGAVVLRSPYTSMVDVGKKHYPFLPVYWLLKDRYESIKKIQKIKAPLLIVHGERDDIIPARLGRRLYDAAPQPKVMKTYPLAGHNDLPDVSPAVIQFLKAQQVCVSKME